MPEKDKAAMFDPSNDRAAEHDASAHAASAHDASAHAAEHGAAEHGAAGTSEDLADRRARAARIRQRSRELVEALGADHPLVTEALARADALDGAETDVIDLRSSADMSR